MVEANYLLLSFYTASLFHTKEFLIANVFFVVNQKVLAILTASQSLMASKKWRAVLSLVLALGNHLNAGRCEPASGFKLQSLNLLNEIKSSDPGYTLLHYIADQVSFFPKINKNSGTSLNMQDTI